jgi:DNA-binding transcriptional regulator GbsR (MarR family)
MNEVEEAKKKIFSTFSDIASSIGYSPLHGQIIGVLLVKGKQLSLQELAKETGYSSSMVSLSLDLLEVLGVVRKVKRTADRKLYIELTGDLLECLKNAIMMRLEKSITSSLKEFSSNRQALESTEGKEKEGVLNTLDILEKEVKRLESYVSLLSKTRLP